MWSLLSSCHMDPVNPMDLVDPIAFMACMDPILLMESMNPVCPWSLWPHGRQGAYGLWDNMAYVDPMDLKDPIVPRESMAYMDHKDPWSLCGLWAPGSL